MYNNKRILFCFAFSIILIVPALLMPVRSARADTVPQRSTIFISDLHWGLGRDATGKWNHMEDFRWPNAFNGFLDAISMRGDNNVDLIVIGDLLDLWQPPTTVKCKGHGENLGCTVDEMQVIVSTVLAAHKTELTALRGFLKKGSNHIYVIPGNHDAALLASQYLENGIESTRSAHWTSYFCS